MHDCQKFREDWVAGFANESVDCKECRRFCEEAQFILQATEAKPVPELSEAFWDRYDDRLRDRLEDASQTYRLYWKWSAAAAAAAITVVITWGGMREFRPAVDELTAEAEADANTIPQIELDDDHIKGLNPTVVSFLAQSELYLRNFTKIEPGKEDLQDLHEAQARAKHVLADIQTQRLRTADFVPVGIALDEYESVLRDINNLESPDDVAQIQAVIRNSGLIASMRAYQPQVVLVGRR
jgi:hypothetical protein